MTEQKQKLLIITSVDIAIEYSKRNDNSMYPRSSVLIALGATDENYADAMELTQELSAKYFEKADPSIIVGEQIEFVRVNDSFLPTLLKHYDCTRHTTIAELKDAIAKRTLEKLGLERKTDGLAL